MKKITFEVAFVPRDIQPKESQVCVLVDVIRATTAMVTMLEKGCSEVILTNDENKTMSHFSEDSEIDTLICAENDDGSPSPHASFSPSLVSINEKELNGKRIILRTTNGTVAGVALWNAGIRKILIGSLHNAEAIMKKAVNIASETNSDITIVCAGRERGEIAALDDAYTAGVLVKYGIEATEALSHQAIIKDSAKISKHLTTVYRNSEEAFENSGSGETMRKLNSIEDIAICSKINISSVTPMLKLSEDDNISVKK